MTGLHDALANQQPLVLHLHERRCAVIQPTPEGLVLTYEPAYIETPGAIALSIRMPLRQEPYPAAIADDWLNGLLPEGPRREAVGVRWNIPNRSPYAMLAAIGAECAGAVEIGFADPDRTRRPIPADEQAIIRALREERLTTAPEYELGARLSLAGMQPKLCLRRENNQWFWPTPSHPSTHILKPESANPATPNLVWNEHTTMELARRIGIPTAGTEITRIGTETVLVITRFDRTMDGRRIHQEDMHQATGMRHKYEAHGGPGAMHWCAKLPHERWKIWDQFMFAWIIGDADRHSKNVSIQHIPNDRPRLAPLYDAVCTTMYPSIDDTMASRIGRARTANDVTQADLKREAGRCGLDPDEAIEKAHEIGEKIRDTLAELTRERGWDTARVKDGGAPTRYQRACDWARA